MSDNVYDNNKPDARLDESLRQVSVFRPRYRKLTPAEMELHDEIKNAAQRLYELYDRIESGREVSLGKTKLEESVMWAVKGLTK